MTNGEFFHVISDAIRGSAAHADLIDLCRKAKILQRTLRDYLDKYKGRELSEELLDLVTPRLTAEQREGYLEKIQGEIEDWDHSAYTDVAGFNWSLNVFASVIENQLFGNMDEEAETDTDLDDSPTEGTVSEGEPSIVLVSA